MEVYGLIDPRSGGLRYVGKTERSAVARLKRHIHNAREGVKSHVYNWLRQLLAAGLKPEVEVLERHETAEALDEAERHFIAYFRSIGCDVVNLTSGGDGSVGYRHTEQSKQKQRAKMAGRKLTPEHRASISQGMMGHLVSKAARAKSSESQRGRILTAEHRSKLSAAQKLVSNTKEWALKQSRSHGGREFVDQHGQTYRTLGEAASQCGCSKANISATLHNRRRSAGGFAFRFVTPDSAPNLGA